MANLATIQPQQGTTVRSNPFEPSSLPEAMTLADTLAKSALVPSALRNKPQDILLILATARELGIGPMQAIADVNVIQGKPVMSADLMLALCKRRPDVCKYIRLVESTPERATYETMRVGAPEPERFTFTIDDAKKLGIAGKDNYQKQPATMLRRRAASQLARETYQDLVRGYDPDEAEDFDRRPVEKQAAVETPVVQPATSSAELPAAGAVVETPSLPTVPAVQSRTAGPKNVNPAAVVRRRRIWESAKDAGETIESFPAWVEKHLGSKKPSNEWTDSDMDKLEAAVDIAF